MASGRVAALLLGNFESGGAERQALELARRLPAHGWRVLAVASEGRGPLRAEFEAAGARCFALGTEFHRGALHPRALLAGTRGIARLASIRRREGVAVVHSFLFWENCLAAPARLLAPGLRVATGRQNIAHFKDGRPHYQRIEDLLNPLVGAVVCNSSAVRADVLARERVNPRRVVVIRNGVDLDRFARAAPADLAAAHPQLAGADCIVCVPAHFKRQKRHDVFLRAFAEARSAQPGLKAALMGRDLGTEQESRALAARLGVDGHIAWLGTEPHPERVLAACGAACLSSDFEGLPNAVLEAMASGLAVAATDAPGTNELVAHGRNGLLSPVGDARALADNLARLAGDGALRARLGRAGRRIAERRYSLDRFAADHARLYGLLAG